MRLKVATKEIIVNEVSKAKYPQDTKDEMKKLIAEQLRATVEVDEGWEKYSKYIRMTSSIVVYFITGNSRYEYDTYQFNCKQYPDTGAIVANTIRGKGIKGHEHFKDNVKITGEAKLLLKKMVKFDEDKIAFRKTLTVTLSAINTYAQLREHLPELEKFIPVERNCGLVPISTFKDMRSQLKGL